MKLTVALAQMALATGGLDQNAATARTLVAQAASQGVQLLLLPELWQTGYDLARADRYAAPLPPSSDGGGTFALMAELAREHHLYLAGTALETNPEGRPFNTAALFGPDGTLLGAYRKAHLWAPMGEVEHMTAGSTLPTFDLPWGKTGLAICYDLRFPELFRRYALHGAQLLIIPSEWPHPRRMHWRTLLQARAIENQCFVAACNRIGSSKDTSFFGASAVIDPWGNALIEGGENENLLTVTLDLSQVAVVRRQIPIFDDRRPELY